MQEQEVKQKMEKAIEALKKNFSGLRTGRASTGLVENIQVELYGSKMPLKQIASINVPENRMISVTPYDRSSIQSIEKAISSSELGLTPKNEGHMLYIRLPELTAERRKDLEKVAKGMAEDSKIAIRNIRRDAIDAHKKTTTSTDETKGYQDKVQKITDEHNHKIEELLKNKEKEIQEV